MSGFDWAAAESAMAQWITGAVIDVPGLQIFQTLAAYQSQQNVTTYPAVVLHRARKVPEGSGDEVYSNTTIPFAGGAEVTQTWRQMFVLHLEVRVLCNQDNASGNMAPDALLERILVELRRDSIGGRNGILANAGLGLREPLGDIDGSPDISAPVWVPQAVAELQFGYAVTRDDQLGYVTGGSQTGVIIEPGRAPFPVPAV